MTDRLVLIGSDEPIGIDAYLGFGNARRVLMHGRVMRSSGVEKSAASDSLFRNLANTYKRIRAHPLAHARIEATIGGTQAEISADNEGFFRSWIDLSSPIPTTSPWVEATLRLPANGASATARVRVVTPEASFGVISDLDDTVIQSRVSNLALAARTIMLGNARTRLPFPGVAALYQALEKGGDGARRNPIYYV